MNWILKRDRLSSFLNQKKAIAPFLINKKSDRLNHKFLGDFQLDEESIFD
jgi:hypothetical protein